MNILPSKNKKIIKVGLRNRFLIVSSILLSFSFLIGIISLVPAYMLVKGYFSFNNNEEIITEEDINNDILLIPAEIDTKLSLVQNHLESQSFISSLEKITIFLPDGVNLNSIRFVRDGGYKDYDGDSVTLSGFSRRRDLLLNFVNELKISENFVLVEVPVSDLTKESNLNFTMNLVYKK